MGLLLRNMNKIKLHPVQEKLLTLFSNRDDEILTFRKIQNELNISSTSLVAHHITQLEKKGFIKRDPNNPRGLQVVNGAPEKKIAYLNLYGLAYCGPIGTILDDHPIESIPIPTRLLSFPSSEGFLVKAKGNSMTPKINEGDLIIAKKTNAADDGQIVVCVNNEEALIKKFHQDEYGNIILISYNSEYSPFLAAEDFRIIGEVRLIISSKI